VILTCACAQCKQKLAALADWRVKKSKEEIAKALSYNGRTDYTCTPYEVRVCMNWQTVLTSTNRTSKKWRNACTVPSTRATRVQSEAE